MWPLPFCTQTADDATVAAVVHGTFCWHPKGLSSQIWFVRANGFKWLWVSGLLSSVISSEVLWWWLYGNFLEGVWQTPSPEVARIFIPIWTLLWNKTNKWISGCWSANDQKTLEAGFWNEKIMEISWKCEVSTSSHVPQSSQCKPWILSVKATGVHTVFEGPRQALMYGCFRQNSSFAGVWLSGPVSWTLGPGKILVNSRQLMSVAPS